MWVCVACACVGRRVSLDREGLNNTLRVCALTTHCVCACVCVCGEASQPEGVHCIRGIRGRIVRCPCVRAPCVCVRAMAFHLCFGDTVCVCVGVGVCV